MQATAGTGKSANSFLAKRKESREVARYAHATEVLGALSGIAVENELTVISK